MFKCTSDGLELINKAHDKFTTEEDFYSPSHSFPLNYGVSVDVKRLTNGCAGIDLRISGSAGYGFFICSDDSWEIVKYGVNTSNASILTYGFFKPSGTTIHLETLVSGSFMILAIDGQAFFGSDNAYSTTHLVSLLVADRSLTVNASATFSHFVYTPPP